MPLKNRPLSPLDGLQSSYEGLQDFPALQMRSNETYDKEGERIRGEGGGFEAMNQINNNQNRVSQWAPFFQATGEQGADKFSGGPSPFGSNQFRGQSLQPSYFDASLQGLKRANVPRSR